MVRLQLNAAVALGYTSGEYKLKLIEHSTGDVEFIRKKSLLNQKRLVDSGGLFEFTEEDWVEALFAC